MAIDVAAYLDYTRKPWGQLYYDTVASQLACVPDGAAVLDIGAGFGVLAARLCDRCRVTALEPDEAMRAHFLPQEKIALLAGGFPEAAALPAASFDAVLCHNVLEYVDVDGRPAAFAAMARALRPGGLLSLIAHNRPGKVAAAAVFQADPGKAAGLLAGDTAYSLSFGEISDLAPQDVEALCASCGLRVEQYMGVRMFFGLVQNNEVKFDPAWQKAALALELQAAKLDPYRQMAFYRHYHIRQA